MIGPDEPTHWPDEPIGRAGAKRSDPDGPDVGPGGQQADPTGANVDPDRSSPGFHEIYLDPDEPYVVPDKESPGRAGPEPVPEVLSDGPEGMFSGPEGLFAGPDGLFPGPDGLFTGPHGPNPGSDGLFAGPGGLVEGPDTQPRPEPEPEPEASGDAVPPREHGNLRNSALQGGAYLAVREVVGMGLRVMGVVIVTRRIGPHSFGIYSGAAAFIAVVITVAQMGMEVYLIRQPVDPTRRLYNEVFSFIATLSLISVLVGLALSVALDHVHPGAAPSVRVFRLLLISVPLNALWAPAQARIERSFGFRKMAMLELGGDLVLYGVAVPLAILGWGPYSLAVGVIAWQGWLLVGSYRMARMVPRLCMPSATWFDFMRHGLAYSSSSWVNSILGLANPIVVGRYFGATGVGYVALASRLVDTIGFAQRATWRLGLVALSKVQGDRERARRGVEEGMVLQVLMVAVPMVAVAVFGKLVIPFVFGTTWLPALDVFALLGAASILNAPLTVQMALLYSRAKNQAVVIACIANAAIVFGAAFLFVPIVGIDGYGLAAIVGTAGWMIIYVQARRVQEFNPLRPLPWMLAFVPAMLFPFLSWPVNLTLLVPLLLLVVNPEMRRQLHEYIGLIVSRVRGAGSP